MYIDKCWSTHNTILRNHTDCNLEMMTIKSRPHWLPREFSSIILISCYAPFTGNSRHKAATTSTINTIKSHITQMELKYPDACFIIMGDFNQLPLKLNSYQQIVKKPTRNNKVLDKCFTKVKDGYDSVTNQQSLKSRTIKWCISSQPALHFLKRRQLL